MEYHFFIAKIFNKKVQINNNGIILIQSKTYSLKIKIIGRKNKSKMILLMMNNLLVFEKFKTFLPTVDNLIGAKWDFKIVI